MKFDIFRFRFSMTVDLCRNLLDHRICEGVFLICLEQDDAKKVIIELNDGPAGGHFFGDTTAHKILRARYY